MRHLSPAELVDYAEGTLDAGRGAHADRCARCGNAARDLRDTLQRTLAAGDAVPEPSPLFWDHLSARVQDRLASESIQPRAPQRWAAAVRVLVPITACALVVAVAMMMRPAPDRSAQVTPPVAQGPAPLSVDIDRPLDPALDETTAEVWSVLTAAAADLEWEAAHEAGMGVGPAAVDRAVQQLSAAELNELGRLLQTELKRSSD